MNLESETKPIRRLFPKVHDETCPMDWTCPVIFLWFYPLNISDSLFFAWLVDNFDFLTCSVGLLIATGHLKQDVIEKKQICSLTLFLTVDQVSHTPLRQSSERFS